MKFAKTKIYAVAILAIAHYAMLSADFFITNNTGRSLVAVTQLCGSQIIKIGINVPVGKSRGQNSTIPGTCQYTVMTDDGAYYIFNDVFTGKFTEDGGMDINKASSGKGIAIDIWRKPYTFDQTVFVDPARFKEYVGPLPQVPGGPALKIAPMDPELESALNLNNKEAVKKYLQNHPRINSPKDAIDANLAFIADFIKQHPLSVDSANVNGQSPLFMLLNTYEYLSGRSVLSRNAMKQSVHALVDSLLRTYRVNPNAATKNGQVPLAIAIAIAQTYDDIKDFPLVQMLLYAGADVNMISKKVFTKQYDAIFDFVTDWAKKKGMSFKVDAPAVSAPVNNQAANKPTSFTQQELEQISFEGHKASDILGQVTFGDKPKYCAEYMSQRGLPEIYRGNPTCLKWIIPSEDKAKLAGWSFNTNYAFSKGEIILIHFANMQNADLQYKLPPVDNLVYGIVLLDTDKDRLGFPKNKLYIQIDNQEVSVPQYAINIGKFIGKNNNK